MKEVVGMSAEAMVSDTPQIIILARKIYYTLYCYRTVVVVRYNNIATEEEEGAQFVESSRERRVV